jgi:NAD(P)-dependent dehydrogenase (short-subunit alcohol dehydrogenase family)
MSVTEDLGHPAIAPGKFAVITGGADGIGRATAERLAGLGMTVAILDNRAEAFASATAALERFGGRVIGRQIDIADRAAVEACASKLIEEVGVPSVLMNNAGMDRGGDILSDPTDWERLISVNLMGVFYGVSAFLPAMIDAGEPGLIVNTGSKQGITQPPGNTAYNVSKAAVKSLTEGLAHTLREKTGDRISAHLLVPGFTFTGMTCADRQDKPEGAWLPEQVADFLLVGIAHGDFYILCPDDETSPETDRKRIAWAMGDLLENRPALSRWHPGYKAAFEAFMA